mmetsp:Transcript_99099/g.296124  ORF Transcript_99099/g.296124 Transcript_99099/m.296124 type:complete len:230 (+) Transcript_99099:36-725(+)
MPYDFHSGVFILFQCIPMMVPGHGTATPLGASHLLRWVFGCCCAPRERHHAATGQQPIFEARGNDGFSQFPLPGKLPPLEAQDVKVKKQPAEDLPSRDLDSASGVIRVIAAPPRPCREVPLSPCSVDTEPAGNQPCEQLGQMEADIELVMPEVCLTPCSIATETAQEACEAHQIDAEVLGMEPAEAAPCEFRVGEMPLEMDKVKAKLEALEESGLLFPLRGEQHWNQEQ